MPKSLSTTSAARLAGGKSLRPVPISVLAGSMTLGSSRTAICGASAALAKRLIASPAVLGWGSVRWKARPSSPGRWAMWSIAAATKSTGTRLISPPSIPIVGSQVGSTRRARCNALKK